MTDRLRFLAILLCIALLGSAEPPPPSSDEAATTGTALTADPSGRPAGWNGVVLASATIVIEDGRRILHLAPPPPPRASRAEIATRVPLPPGWRGVRVQALVRLRGFAAGSQLWQIPRLRCRPYRADGTPIGDNAHAFLDGDQDWTETGIDMTLPDGAAGVEVAPSLDMAAGILDLADLRILRRGALGAPISTGDGREPGWGREPVVDQTTRRGEIVLNGLWRFVPAEVPAEVPPSDPDGWMPVPGSWTPYLVSNSAWALPGLSGAGTGPAWDRLSPTSPAAWYRRDLVIPASWAGRAIELRLDRVSTDATVFLDGRRTGRLMSPGGSVQIAGATPGRHRLDILVEATADPDGRVQMIDAGQSRQQEAPLATRGITGDVILSSRPPGARIDAVAVRTSVRLHRITVIAELADVARSGPVAFTARMLGPDGREERRFEATVGVQATAEQAIEMTWDWPDPRLWDLDRPELYTLRLEAHGAGIDDDFAQEFGFREFRVGTAADGPGAAGEPGQVRLLLNEREFRLRPIEFNNYNTVKRLCPATIRGWLDGIRHAGFNIFEVWPQNFAERGWVDPRPWMYAEADRRGIPLFGCLPEPRPFIYRLPDWQYRWPERRETYRLALRDELRRSRNHPSIVGWVCAGNLFGHHQDQNPRTIGREGWDDDTDPTYRQKQAAGAEVFAMIREADPTRPAYPHMGGQRFGDLASTNHYLGITPLQERESWPAFWAQAGAKPYIAIEFGVPLSATFFRGRANGGYWGKQEGGACQSEMLASEFCAAALGAEAYDLEPSWYRDRIPAGFEGGQMYAYTSESFVLMPACQQYLARWIRGTWRSWRTQGFSGGMVPWNIVDEGYRRPWLGHRFSAPRHLPSPWTALAAWEPGSRGPWWPSVPLSELKPFVPDGGFEPQAGAAALAENQRDTMAWIAGPVQARYPRSAIPASGGAPAAAAPPAWLLKDHHVAAGGAVERSAALVNDGREAVPWSLEWTATADGRRIAGGADHGRLATGGIAHRPILFTAPEVDRRTDVAIALRATLGGQLHEDAVTIRVWPAPPATGLRTVPVVDPAGLTSGLLARLGVAATPWDGSPGAGHLIVGRGGLESADDAQFARLEGFVAAGGRLLVMAQDPEWMRRRLGLRVHRLLTRQVFPMPHPGTVMSGLDAEDLRDWTGEGTLVEPYPWDLSGDGDAALGRRPTSEPAYGWRWGAAGTVTSAAIEKPHRSGWRPLAECEFDLAYTPFMELALGRGAVAMCTFDVEGRPAGDPAVDEVARRMLAWLAAPTPDRPQRTVYLGDPAGRALLDGLGVRIDGADAAAAGPDALVLAGPGADPRVVEAHAAAGGRTVVLPRRGADDLAPVVLVSAAYPDRRPPAWPLAAGLGASDLRWRVPADAWLLAPASGIEIAAGGQLGRRRVGAGEIWYAQVDPDRFQADAKTYYRYSRWRQTRALCQVLANAGAVFAADRSIFLPRPIDRHAPLALAGDWEFQPTVRIPTVPRPEAAPADPGISAAARAAVADGAGTWQVRRAPGQWEGWGGAWSDFDGEVVARRRIEVPAGLAGGELLLELGAIDDVDTAYWDGVAVGTTTTATERFWEARRSYRIPAALATAGSHVVSVRIFDRFGGGGFAGPAEAMRLRALPGPDRLVPPLYHPDWRGDYILGDDPARYRRW